MFDFIEKLVRRKLTLLVTSICLLAYLTCMFVLPVVNTSCKGVELRCRWYSLMDTLELWQTFNASVLAFIASILVIFSTTISERKARAKRRDAKLAFLPQALSEISTYIEEIVNVLEAIKNKSQAEDLPVIPQTPGNALNRVEKFIEASDYPDEIIVKHLVIATNVIQIYESRLRSLVYDKSIINRDERASYQINQCVRLNCLISGMYGYARSEEDTYEVTSLNKDKLRANKLPIYMTEQEMIDLTKKAITLQLFCTD